MLTRDEEERSGGSLSKKRNKEGGGVVGYLGNKKERKRDMKIVASSDTEQAILFTFGPWYVDSPPRSRG